jgi:hypothetical protein
LLPVAVLLKNTLASVTGLVSAWFKTLPLMVYWAKLLAGNMMIKKTRALNIMIQDYDYKFVYNR